MTRDRELRDAAEDLVDDVLVALGFQPIPGGHDHAVVAVKDRLSHLRAKWVTQATQAFLKDYDEDAP